MKKKNLHRILVAVDGSDQAFQAVEYVGRVLSPENAQVVLFHVLNKIPEVFWDLEKTPEFYRPISPATKWALQQERSMNDFMVQARNILIDAGFPEEAVKVTIQERKVGIARDITAESRHGYSAVVVGRKGLSRLKDLVLGSVASKLIEKLIQTPVWVIGESPKTGKILLALDGSEAAMKAVDYVGSLLEGSDVQVTLFYAIRGTAQSLGGYEHIFITELDEQWLEKAKIRMNPIFNKAKDRLAAAKLDPNKISTKLVTMVNSRAGAIVEEAVTNGFGTIVVGRRGLSKVQEFLMGRVSNKVLQLAGSMAVWVVS